MNVWVLFTKNLTVFKFKYKLNAIAATKTTSLTQILNIYIYIAIAIWVKKCNFVAAEHKNSLYFRFLSKFKLDLLITKTFYIRYT